MPKNKKNQKGGLELLVSNQNVLIGIGAGVLVILLVVGLYFFVTSDERNYNQDFATNSIIKQPVTYTVGTTGDVKDDADEVFTSEVKKEIGFTGKGLRRVCQWVDKAGNEVTGAPEPFVFPAQKSADEQSQQYRLNTVVPEQVQKYKQWFITCRSYKPKSIFVRLLPDVTSGSSDKLRERTLFAIKPFADSVKRGDAIYLETCLIEASQTGHCDPTPISVEKDKKSDLTSLVKSTITKPELLGPYGTSKGQEPESSIIQGFLNATKGFTQNPDGETHIVYVGDLIDNASNTYKIDDTEFRKRVAKALASQTEFDNLYKEAFDKCFGTREKPNLSGVKVTVVFTQIQSKQADLADFWEKFWKKAIEGFGGSFKSHRTL